MATLQETCDFYVSLLCLQFKQLPKARANILIYVKQAVADMLATELQDAFNVDTAVGVQLDTLGKYIGVPRTVGDPIDRPYYSFSDSDGTIRPNGFQDSTNPAQNAQAIWYQSGFLGTNRTALSDVAYKLVLQLQIILNANDSTLASIQDYLHTFLPGMVALTDNADMTLTYTLSQRIPVSPGVLKQFLPKPMGVGLIFVTLTASFPTPILKTLTVAHGDHSLHSVTSDSHVVSVANGVGPYSYSWEFVSGDPTVIILQGDPTVNSQQWFMQGVATVTKTAVWRCVASDSRGINAVTNDITVTLTIQEAP